MAFSLKPRTKLCLFASLYIYLVMLAARAVFLVSGELYDSDDYLRMVRVFDFLDGRARHDFTQPRLGPAWNEDAVAWSPLIDWVLAIPVAVFEPLTGRMDAAILTAAIYPFLMLLAFIFALHWCLRQGFSERQAWWGPVLVAVPSAISIQFLPGRVDHHSLQIILVTLAFGCLLRLYRTPRILWPPALAGALMGLSWSVSAETIPWAGLMAAVIGLFWILDKERAPLFRRAGLLFGFGLLTATIIFLPVTSPLSAFVTRECDAISLTHIGFAGAALSFWLGIGITPVRWRSSTARRLSSGALLAAGLGLIVFIFFEDCIVDPYALNDPELRRIWLDQNNDPKPLWRYLGEILPERLYPLVGILGLNTLALFICFLALRTFRHDREEKILWLAVTALMAAAFIMPFWQIRTSTIGQVLALAPVSWLFVRLEESYSAFRAGDRRMMAVTASPFLLTIITLLAIAGLAYRESSPLQEAMPYGPAQKCDIQAASRRMSALPSPQTIAANVFDGAELLFRTPHRVLAGSYQRNAEGIMAAHRILMADNDAAARALAETYKVSLILVCEEDLPYWHETGGPDNLARRLFKGDAPPWLSLLAKENGYVIYKVE